MLRLMLFHLSRKKNRTNTWPVVFIRCNLEVTQSNMKSNTKQVQKSNKQELDKYLNVCQKVTKSVRMK